MYAMNVERKRISGTHLDSGMNIHVTQNMLQDIDGNFDILASWRFNLLHFPFSRPDIAQA